MVTGLQDTAFSQVSCENEMLTWWSMLLHTFPETVAFVVFQDNSDKKMNKNRIMVFCSRGISENALMSVAFLLQVFYSNFSNYCLE